MTLAHLEELAALVSPEALAVSASAFASSLRVERMAETVVNSTVRIFDLISAIKDYSYMDQAPIQEIDLAQSLDTTLTMFNSRLEHVSRRARVQARGAPHQRLRQRAQPGLDRTHPKRPRRHERAPAPTAPARHPAPQDQPTRRDGHRRSLERRPRHPPEIVSRIFEPFYTTKPPGQGLGLGLDSVTRIVSKHNGFVTVESRPGATCFQVRLPIERAQAY
jgi:signal transduction histidine kinase